MMKRDFDIGDTVICKSSGVIGEVVKFYAPTSCAEQTMVRTRDGRQYHAPTSEWVKVQVGVDIGTPKGDQSILNPYGEYVMAFARNHCVSIEEAYEQPMVKARKAFFDATGM